MNLPQVRKSFHHPEDLIGLTGIQKQGTHNIRYVLIFINKIHIVLSVHQQLLSFGCEQMLDLQKHC